MWLHGLITDLEVTTCTQVLHESGAPDDSGTNPDASRRRPRSALDHTHSGPARVQNIRPYSASNRRNLLAGSTWVDGTHTRQTEELNNLGTQAAAEGTAKNTRRFIDLRSTQHPGRDYARVMRDASPKTPPVVSTLKSTRDSFRGHAETRQHSAPQDASTRTDRLADPYLLQSLDVTNGWLRRCSAQTYGGGTRPNRSAYCVCIKCICYVRCNSCSHRFNGKVLWFLLRRLQSYARAYSKQIVDFNELW
jgi:hypothetical protein